MHNETFFFVAFLYVAFYTESDDYFVLSRRVGVPRLPRAHLLCFFLFGRRHGPRFRHRGRKSQEKKSEELFYYNKGANFIEERGEGEWEEEAAKKKVKWRGNRKQCDNYQLSIISQPAKLSYV